VPFLERHHARQRVGEELFKWLGSFPDPDDTDDDDVDFSRRDLSARNDRLGIVRGLLSMLVSALAVLGAVVYGCTDRISYADDDDDGTGNGGSSGTGNGGSKPSSGTGDGASKSSSGTGPSEPQADCESLCEEAQECPGATPGVDCAAECKLSEQEAAEAGCSGEWDDLMTCIAELEDICTIGEGDCVSEAGAYSDCIYGGSSSVSGTGASTGSGGDPCGGICPDKCIGYEVECCDLGCVACCGL
jgi:hypothetical protein